MRSGRLFLVLAMVAGLVLPAPSQIRRNKVDLTIRVLFNSDRQAGEGLRVQLLTSYGTPIDDRVTDSTGIVTFPQLDPGGYRVRISGNNIEETTSAEIILDPMDNQRMEMVRVNPVSTETASSPGAAPAGPPISAVELNVPDSAKKEFDKGTEAMQKHDLGSARKHFDNAVKIYPKYGYAYNDLGILSAQGGDMPAARNYFQRAIMADDHYAKGYLNLAKLDAMEKNLPGAETNLNKAQSLDPTDAEILFWMARVEAAEGKYQDAIVSCNRVHQLPHQGLAVVHLLAAKAYETQKMPQQAAAEYALYLKEAPNGPDAKMARKSLAALSKQSQKH